MEVAKFKVIDVHISTIKHGDTIIDNNGCVTTIGRNNIKRGFCGISLFGDSYCMGRKLVKKVLI